MCTLQPMSDEAQVNQEAETHDYPGALDPDLLVRPEKQMQRHPRLGV